MNGEEFTFVWTIENFHMVGAEVESGFCGPSFYLKSFLNTEWYLVICPKGCKVGDKDYITCELRRGYDKGPEHIGIDFKLSVGSKTFTRKHVFAKLESSEFDKFIEKKSATLFSKKVFVVKCNMRMINNVEETAHLKKSIFSSLRTFMKTTSHEKKELVMKKQLQELSKNYITYSPRCHYSNQIPVEKRSITYPIIDIVELAQNIKLHIPVISFTRYPSFLITLFTNSNFGDIEIEISLISELNCNILLLCEIEILDIRRDIFKYVKDEHCFKATVYDDRYNESTQGTEEKEIWYYNYAIKRRDLQKLKDGNIHFIMTLTNCSFNWENCIIDSEYNFSSSEKKAPPNTLSREMFRLYSEKKLCDLSIQTKDKTFEVHRNVLAAMSSVFASMFETGSLEADANVQIDDLDSETISQMIHFLYTEDAAELDYESAMKLFVAADKYKITSLKETCRNFLKRNCSVENINLVLSLADTYNDKELQRSVISHVYALKRQVLS